MFLYIFLVGLTLIISLDYSYDKRSSEDYESEEELDEDYDEDDYDDDESLLLSLFLNIFDFFCIVFGIFSPILIVPFGFFILFL